MASYAMAEVAPLDELMGRLADGDRSCFAPVFERLWAPTQRLCRRLVANEADADDAAQSAMVRILERASAYDRRRPALPWALGIAAWECRTLRTRRERLKETSEPHPESDEGAAVEAQEQRLLVEAAVAALGELSEADRETLVSTYWDTAAPVAGATLRKRRERALTRLREAFRRLYGLD